MYKALPKHVMRSKSLPFAKAKAAFAHGDILKTGLYLLWCYDGGPQSLAVCFTCVILRRLMCLSVCSL